MKKLIPLRIFLRIRHTFSCQHQMSDHNVPSKKRIACPVFFTNDRQAKEMATHNGSHLPMYQENPWFEKLFCFQYRVMTRFSGQYSKACIATWHPLGREMLVRLEQPKKAPLAKNLLKNTHQMKCWNHLTSSVMKNGMLQIEFGKIKKTKEISVKWYFLRLFFR